MDLDKKKYFYRNVMLSRNGNDVTLVDILNPSQKGEKLEKWLGLVLLFADGQHTIQELIDYMSRTYQGAAPPTLEKTLLSSIKRLLETNFIQLTEKVTELPYYLSQPVERLDLNKAKEALAKDGHIEKKS